MSGLNGALPLKSTVVCLHNEPILTGRTPSGCLGRHITEIEWRYKPVQVYIRTVLPDVYVCMYLYTIVAFGLKVEMARLPRETTHLSDVWPCAPTCSKGWTMLCYGEISHASQGKVKTSGNMHTRRTYRSHAGRTLRQHLWRVQVRSRLNATLLLSHTSLVSSARQTEMKEKKKGTKSGYVSHPHPHSHFLGSMWWKNGWLGWGLRYCLVHGKGCLLRFLLNVDHHQILPKHKTHMPPFLYDIPGLPLFVRKQPP